VELPQLLEISDGLHQRVQGFAARADSESFDALALDIARFQTEASPGFRRLLRGRALRSLADVPALPSDAFRLTRVATFPEQLDSVRFVTSGTTGAERGRHVMRRTDTYEQLSLAAGKSALLPAQAAGAPPVVVALATAPTTPESSSLSYMMARFMARFDGQPLDGAEARFEALSSHRWLLSDAGVSMSGLTRAIRAAGERGSALLLLGTAFALVRLLDDLLGQPVPLPAGSLIMQTGGFKGRSREVSMPRLRGRLSAAFDVAPERVVGEYGMTELTSQLYEASIAESELGLRHPGVEPGFYFEPPWLRVAAVDPVSLAELPEGEVGLACFTDLGNVDSALRIVTQDLVRRTEGGIQLLGRQPGAPPRGCSLAIEALLGG